MIRWFLKAATMAAVGALAVTSAKADIEFEQRGAVAYLHSHRIRPGDEETVRGFLEKPTGARLAYHLHGQPRRQSACGDGDRTDDPRAWDRHRVRPAPGAAGAPAPARRCSSAASTATTSAASTSAMPRTPKLGLGFHPPKHPSEEGEDIMNGYYRSMGAPGARRRCAIISTRVRASTSLSRASAGVVSGSSTSPAAGPRSGPASRRAPRRLPANR